MYIFEFFIRKGFLCCPDLNGEERRHTIETERQIRHLNRTKQSDKQGQGCFKKCCSQFFGMLGTNIKIFMGCHHYSAFYNQKLEQYDNRQYTKLKKKHKLTCQQHPENMRKAWKNGENLSLLQRLFYGPVTSLITRHRWKVLVCYIAITVRMPS